MAHTKTSRYDTAHHHPRVHRAGSGTWVWVCDCGGASRRAPLFAFSWRQAVIGALNHAACLAP